MKEIKLKVLSKKVEVEKDGKKRSFLRYFAPVKIVVKGEEDKGRQSKQITVKFKQSVQTPNVRFFILTCEENDISCPFAWEIKTKEDGKKEYPVIWIRGYKSFEALSSKGGLDKHVEFETEDIETEEVEIKDADKDTDLPF